MWIKTQDGALVNLDRVGAIMIVGGGQQVDVKVLLGDELTHRIFTGRRDEAQGIVDWFEGRTKAVDVTKMADQVRRG